MTQRVSEADAGPFDLGDGRVGALCLHGLTGRPYEIRPVAEALVNAGMRAVGPLLPGHEETPERLARIEGDEWVRAVHDAYRALRREHETVVLAGVSLGGVLSLLLASEEPVTGLAVIGTPIELRFPIPQLVPWVRHVVPYVRKRGGSNIRDPAARARHPGFDVMPLHAVHELVRLQHRVRAALSRIEAPILVAHGVHDTTANPADAHRIVTGVSSRRRELLMLENSAHIVPVDHDGAALSDAICAFFSGLA